MSAERRFRPAPTLRERLYSLTGWAWLFPVVDPDLKALAALAAADDDLAKLLPPERRKK